MNLDGVLCLLPKLLFNISFMSSYLFLIRTLANGGGGLRAWPVTRTEGRTSEERGGFNAHRSRC